MFKLSDHPCFSADCQPNSGRVHLPVAKNCDLFCRFCSRGINPFLNAPGATREVISPQEALDVISLALKLCPELKVAGIAGPGDPLSGPEALETLFLIKEAYPHLLSCLSTNGLKLAANMEKILLLGLKTVTVTVNAVDPHILRLLNAGIIWDGKFLGGRIGAQTLIDAQEEGIRLASANSLIVKINFVLAPGINGEHVGEVARRARDWGADLLNIIPLIPAGALKDHPAPTPEQIARATQSAREYLPVKTNCRHCRADACGIPGGVDYGPLLYGGAAFGETFSHG
ncbi:MAG: radical SAM protein [Deltaproteobacteria bacterium]|jgi:nitrogen fixation protein NifB|nr:radical SAM protein [Deltaproteobacteria bacterium]